MSRKVTKQTKKPMKKKNYLNAFFPFNDNGSGLAPRLRVVVVFFSPLYMTIGCSRTNGLFYSAVQSSSEECLLFGV